MVLGCKWSLRQIVCTHVLMNMLNYVLFLMVIIAGIGVDYIYAYVLVCLCVHIRAAVRAPEWEDC